MSSFASSRPLPPLWIVLSALFALALWLIVQLHDLVSLLVIGFAIAYVIDPVVSLLERRGIRRWIGTLTVFFGLVCILALLILTSAPTLASQAQVLADRMPELISTGHSRMVRLLSWIQSFIPARFRGSANPGQFLPDFSVIVSRVGQGLGEFLSRGYALTQTVVNMVLLPFIVFYSSVDLPLWYQNVIRAIPVLHRSSVAKILDEINQCVSSYVRGQLMVCVILSVLYMIGLQLAGLELWLVLAVISGFGNMVPYLGFILGVLLSSLMSMVTYGDLGHLLQVWIVYGVVQALEGTFITPRIMGRQLGLSPLSIMLALVVGGQLFGLLGIILAVPGAATLKVVLRHAHGGLISGRYA